MKYLKLLMVLLTLVGGLVYAHADTSLLSEKDGWQKVTSLTDIQNNYYVLVDNASDYMVRLESDKLIHYRSSVDPTSDLSFVWTIEECNTAQQLYYIRNIANDPFQIQTESNAAHVLDIHDVPKGNDWSNMKFVYTNGAWTIENIHFANNFWGYWDPSVGVTSESGRVAGNKNAANAGKYQIYAISRKDLARLMIQKATPESPVNGTALIRNASFDGNTDFGWTRNNKSGGNYNFNGAVEKWHYGVFNIHQTVSLPNGRYTVKVQAVKSTTAYLYASSANTTEKQNISETGGGSNFNDVKNSIAGNSQLGLVSVDITVTDEKLTLGLADENTGDAWLVFDNFQLQMVDPYLSQTALPLPANGQLEADQWYVYDVVSDGKYALSATEGVAITQTDQLKSAPVTTDATELLELTVGKLFLKSSTAQTLVITPQTFTYEVGQAHADITMVQPGNTVNVTYADIATNDPEAAIAYNLSGITLGETVLECTPTAKGFRFTVPAVSSNKELTLTIPAGAIGYAEGAIYNDEQQITLHTPTVLDGLYFLSTSVEGKTKYLSRMTDNNAGVDHFGLAFKLTTDTENTSTFQFLENANFYLDDNNNYAVATKNKRGANTNQWVIVAEEDGYKVRLKANTSCELTVANTETGKVEITHGTQNGYVWHFVSIAEHAAAMQQWTDKQAAEAADAADISATTKSELEAVILDATAYASRNIPLTGNYNVTSVQDKYQAGGNLFGEQTLENLSNGLYKLTVYAYQRISDNATTYDAYQKGFIGTEYLEANGQQTLIKSVMDVKAASPWVSGNDYAADGGYYPNNTTGALAAFNAGNYKNDVYVYVSDGTLKYKLYNPSNPASANWTPYYSFSLTFYTDEVTDEEAESIIQQSEEAGNAYIEEAVKEQLTDALNTFRDDRTIVNFNALTTAIAAASASKDAYAAAADYLTKVEALLSNTNFYTAAAKAAVYDTPRAKYDDRTLTTDEINSSYTYQARSYSPESDRYLKNTAGNLLMPGWTINGQDATIEGSGFYQNTWSTEDNFGLPFYELWTSAASLSATQIAGTISGLVPNTEYAVSAIIRVQGNDKVEGSITMQVGDGKKIDVTTGNRIGATNRYMSTFTAAGYTNEEGELTLRFDVAAGSNINWLAFKHVNYVQLAGETEYTNLQKAITDASSKLIGFEDGEYAPYANKKAIAALTAAQAIDQEGENALSTVLAVTEALTTATWTANEGEVNGFRWSKDDYIDDTDSQVPLGFANGNGENIRISANNGTNKGLNQLAQPITLNINTNDKAAIYGSATGYTLPLKANTVYRLSFVYAGWGNSSGSPIITVEDANQQVVKKVTINPTDVRGDNTTKAWTAAAVLFKTGAAGNYQIAFGKSGNRTAFGDLSLVKSTGTETVTVSAVGLATYASDNDLDFTALGVSAYRATVEGNTVTFSRVTTVPAGEGVLLRHTGTFEVPVTNGLEPWNEDDNAFVRGSGETVQTGSGPYNYILNLVNGLAGFYRAAGQVVDSNRAYLQSSVNASRITTDFDDDATGISSIEQRTDLRCFDLQGRQVAQPVKGLYVTKNGKKVIIK